jgi:hypothetical protein
MMFSKYVNGVAKVRNSAAKVFVFPKKVVPLQRLGEGDR